MAKSGIPGKAFLFPGGEEDVEADGGEEEGEEEEAGEEVPEAGPDGEGQAFLPVDAEELGIVDGEEDGHQADADFAFAAAGEEQGEEHEKAELAEDIGSGGGTGGFAHILLPQRKAHRTP